MNLDEAPIRQFVRWVPLAADDSIIPIATDFAMILAEELVVLGLLESYTTSYLPGRYYRITDAGKQICSLAKL